MTACMLRNSIVALFLLSLLCVAPTSQTASFVAFESGQVRPLALSPDGSRLFVTNTPDNRLEIFVVTDAGLEHEQSIPIGLEPVAVAARSANEVWVVNHLSDDVSVVQLQSGAPARVVDTLQVGDEPRDIVFANGRAFVTTAHRGQSSPFPYKPVNTEGRADVWVFNGAARRVATIVNLFGDTPRALAVSPDGNTVYAGIFQSGNRSTVLSRNTVFGRLPPPLTNADGVPIPPDIGLVVQFDGSDWRDGAGGEWNTAVRVRLPDYDVFAIDASADTPVEVARYPGVGTTLYGIVVNPASGVLYVSNTEARNVVRFEGPGEFFDSTVRGHFIENRITVIDHEQVRPRHLNKHIDYDVFPGTQAENDASLALPLQMVVTDDGETLYLAAFGSSKIGVFATDELDDDSFTPSPADHVELTGGGPSGLALDAARERLYVLTRFDNSISIVDIASSPGREVAHVRMFNPEPVSLVDGRRFLYDARHTSSRGDSSCGGCHVFGDTDHLVWDLGNPDGEVMPNPNEMQLPVPPTARNEFHPVKGPMSTQSLRGMAGNGPMHWRGDRTGGSQPGGDPMDENAAFLAFNVAFEGLLGREGPLPQEEMQAFADFALQLTFPPNPIRRLDNTRTPSEARGLDIFRNRPTDNRFSCGDCHILNPAGGRFGTMGLSVVRLGPDEIPLQPLKIPHLRNLYTKVGFIGASQAPPFRPPTGDQIRGFGFRHDGSADTLLTFLDDFALPDMQDKLDLMSFLLSFDSNLAPVSGQQVTLAPDIPFAEVGQRLTLLIQRSEVMAPIPECDLVVKGSIGSEQRGWLRGPSGVFRSDRVNEAPRTLAELRQLSNVPGQEMTFSCVPSGSGLRIALDRDEDGFFDRDELDAGSDPADPGSIPGG